MTLRLYIDEDISDRVAQGIRRTGGDALSVLEAHQEGLPDDHQLAYAAANGRVLVTYNRVDFQRLDAEWRLAGREHAGIFWCGERMIPRRDIGTLIRSQQRVSEQNDSLENLFLPLTVR